MNFSMFAVSENKNGMARMMAEDIGAAELPNPVFCFRAGNTAGKIRHFIERMKKNWKEFRRLPDECEYCRMAALLH